MRAGNSSAKPSTDAFRTVMAHFPTGVAIVTSIDACGRPRGMTCSSVCSVTLRPPTLIVCLRSASPTLDAVRHRGTFTVNFLHHGSQQVAELFASGAVDRFDRVDWHTDPGSGNPHLTEAAHATADCRVSDTHHVGDHCVVIGRVIRIRHDARHRPLLYGLRRYAPWPPPVD